jgi:hypothetical protein
MVQVSISPVQRSPRAFKPIEDDAAALVAVFFQRRHVAVADDTALGEKAKVGFGAAADEPIYEPSS